MSISIDVKTLKTGFWHLPKVFYAVLFIEFWERFAFYGLQGVAVIYFVEKFGMQESTASDLFGSFFALLCASLTLGGFIGDKVLGLRRTYLLGIIFLIIGYAIISLSTNIYNLYLGMALVLVGNMFFKTNATNYVGRCFESNDPRFDAAFTYFYMVVNLGSFSGIVLIPILSQKFSYMFGLLIPSLAMIVALFSYFLLRLQLSSVDNQIGKNPQHMLKKLILVISIGIVMAFVLSFLLKNLTICKIVLYVIAITTIGIYLFIASKMNHKEAKGMYLALILMIFAFVFWVLYIQAATSITFFALHNIRLTFLGYTLPAGVTQSFDSIFLVVFAPLLASLYINLNKLKINFSLPAKFISGIFLMGACFVILGIGGQFFSDNNAQISILWLVLAYMFFAIGELFISALGPSMVAQLLPKRIGGFAQGIWFISTAIGMKVGGELSSFVMGTNSANFDATISLHMYLDLFYKLGGAAISLAFILSYSIKPLSKAMQNVLENKY